MTAIEIKKIAIDEALVDDFITRALYEDVRDGDHTSLATIPADARDTARLLVKDVGVISGIAIAERVFKKVDPDCTFTQLINDGTAVRYGDVAFTVECNSQALLTGERLALNIMQRMSGISSLANRYLFEVEDLDVKIIDTRKTTPNLRYFEKMAVRLGGCHNYRIGLYDWIMIKDNHIDACGGITQAINRVEAYQKENNLNLNVTVEVRNLVELQEVLSVGKVTRIMLDNFDLPILHEAVQHIDRRFETEASGGINIHTIRNVAMSGVDFISVGALTHSATSLDMSLKIIK